MIRWCEVNRIMKPILNSIIYIKKIKLWDEDYKVIDLILSVKFMKKNYLLEVYSYLSPYFAIKKELDEKDLALIDEENPL